VDLASEYWASSWPSTTRRINSRASQKPRRRRGGPKGPRYHDDFRILNKVADAVVCNPGAKLKTEIRASGIDGDANIRRIERHFNANKNQLIENARRRARPPQAVSPPEYPREPRGLYDEFYVSKLINPMTQYRELFERYQPSATQLVMTKMLANMDCSTAKIGQLMLNFGERGAHKGIASEIAALSKRTETYGSADNIRRALMGTYFGLTQCRSK
jgi:hypothetical protein